MTPDVTNLPELYGRIRCENCVSQNGLALMMNAIFSNRSREVVVQYKSDQLPDASCSRAYEQGNERNHKVPHTLIERDGSSTEFSERSIDPETCVNIFIDGPGRQNWVHGASDCLNTVARENESRS